MESLDRRYEPRVPLEMYLNTYVDDRLRRALTVNVSETGVYFNTLLPAPLIRPVPMGLEFTLPGIDDSIWAAGEICHGALDNYVCSTAVRFVRMADRHRRMLRDFLSSHLAPDLDALMAESRELPAES
jgi:hypothetical protein